MNMKEKIANDSRLGPSITFKDKTFTAVYSKKKNKTGKTLATMHIVAKHMKSDKIIWENKLDGGTASEYNDLRLNCKGLEIKKNMLFVDASLGNSKTIWGSNAGKNSLYFFLNPETGQNIIESSLIESKKLNESNEIKLELQEIKKNMVSIFPGWEIIFIIKNNSKNSVYVSNENVSYKIEIIDNNKKFWREIIQSHTSKYDSGELAKIKKGETFKISLDSKSIDKLASFSIDQIHFNIIVLSDLGLFKTQVPFTMKQLNAAN